MLIRPRLQSVHPPVLPPVETDPSEVTPGGNVTDWKLKSMSVDWAKEFCEAKKRDKTSSTNVHARKGTENIVNFSFIKSKQ